MSIVSSAVSQYHYVASDAVVIGRQHVRNGIATLRTEKSQGEITVTLPILPVLQRTLDAGPIGELTFICGQRGKPFKKESFGTAFKEACVAAGLHNRSAHGCRKIGATRAAEEGASVAQLNAIFGWNGTAMASLYTQAAIAGPQPKNPDKNKNFDGAAERTRTSTGCPASTSS